MTDVPAVSAPGAGIPYQRIESETQLLRQSYNYEVKHRKRTTKLQLALLEAAFTRDSKPLSAIRKQLASETAMPIRDVQVWFQNRRAKEKNLSLKVRARGTPGRQLLKGEDQVDDDGDSDAGPARSLTPILLKNDKAPPATSANSELQPPAPSDLALQGSPASPPLELGHSIPAFLIGSKAEPFPSDALGHPLPASTKLESAAGFEYGLLSLQLPYSLLPRESLQRYHPDDQIHGQSYLQSTTSRYPNPSIPAPSGSLFHLYRSALQLRRLASRSSGVSGPGDMQTSFDLLLDGNQPNSAPQHHSALTGKGYSALPQSQPFVPSTTQHPPELSGPYGYPAFSQTTPIPAGSLQDSMSEFQQRHDNQKQKGKGKEQVPHSGAIHSRPNIQSQHQHPPAASSDLFSATVVGSWQEEDEKQPQIFEFFDELESTGPFTSGDLIRPQPSPTQTNPDHLPYVAVPHSNTSETLEELMQFLSITSPSTMRFNSAITCDDQLPSSPSYLLRPTQTVGAHTSDVPRVPSSTRQTYFIPYITKASLAPSEPLHLENRIHDPLSELRPPFLLDLPSPEESSPEPESPQPLLSLRPPCSLPLPSPVQSSPEPDSPRPLLELRPPHWMPLPSPLQLPSPEGPASPID